MKRCILGLLLVCQVAGAEQVFVRNRPFPAVVKSDRGWGCKLQDLAPALALPLTQAGSRWILGQPTEEAPEGESGVYFQGKRLQSVDAGLEIADLQAFIQEIGGRYVVNKGMRTVDLYAPTAMLGRAISCNNVHVLMFHRPENNGQQVATLSDTLAETRGLEGVAIDYEDTGHPLWQQWGRYWTAGPMPMGVMVDPAGRVLGHWSGQLPPVSQVRQLFGNFVAQRAQLNAQRVNVSTGASTTVLSGG